MKWLVVLIMPIVLMAADPALRSIIVSQDGKMVTLDDNTTYEIAPRDQNIAFGWIGGAQV